MGMKFPLDAVPKGTEDVQVSGPGFSFTLCAHGARELAQRLVKAADQQYCDGYRHGDDSTMFVGSTPLDHSKKSSESSSSRTAKLSR